VQLLTQHNSGPELYPAEGVMSNDSNDSGNSVYRLSPAQIRKLNKALGKDFSPNLPISLEVDLINLKSWVFCIPEDKLEIPFKVAFNL
jgi:hypothetical protein